MEMRKRLEVYFRRSHVFKRYRMFAKQVKFVFGAIGALCLNTV